ncbi:hypothetical protein TVAG_228800 [Trichomonas vaginalis G3]|uniref:C2 NT-type domain-containing protein n=1 Tax=Trichomonas vaginalis (strain ATCC PRA-98 / G3) TaxID=412133 RepID=A2DJ42_TRIV3|nr:C2 domain (calcium/lipid-binding domain, CaLB) family [Trichomonas vaginalis G3]EAY19617.1 hypothetical protein TVAG_228800 [Trichomonas vaginalis G3]KAI5515057.1 C2 domain (calcium/lipid-binding domain, CaLB) family [Trichomonas vaginalis G3]|eukprot:XP_001580603.1 hypothetical protein [Trichomonas vaginalis G3]
MMNNYDYLPLMNGNRAFIRIESVSTGSFKTNGKATLVARVGPRTTFMRHSCEFTEKNKPFQTWDFKYTDPARASFVVVLFKKHIFGGDEEIGEIELRLSAFEANSVVTQEFALKSPSKLNVPAKATISVHLSEDGAEAFDVPEGKIISNAEIPHKTTYFK